ncbi:MAG: hypothetical protein ACLT3Y_09700 [Ruminococcus callidus]
MPLYRGAGRCSEPVAQVIEMSASPHHTKVVYEAWCDPRYAAGAGGCAADDADPVPLPGQPWRIGPVPCAAL